MTLDTFGFVSALQGSSPTFRRRMGTVVSIQSSYTITVKLAGDTTEVSGVRYFGHYAPEVGVQVWIDTDGSDLICVGAIAGLGGSVPAAKATKTANQSLGTSGTAEIVTFSAAVFDTCGMYDNANDRFVIPVSGIYTVTANIGFDANATGGRAVWITQSGTNVALQRVQAQNSASVSTWVNVSAVISATVGDTVYVQAAQYSGGSLQMIPSGDLAHFAICYQGPAS